LLKPDIKYHYAWIPLGLFIPSRGVTRGAGGHNFSGAESLWGRRMTAEGTKRCQNCHKYFLQYSTFASETPQVRTWGRQTCFLPWAPSNLVTPLIPRNATVKVARSLEIFSRTFFRFVSIEILLHAYFEYILNIVV